MSQPAPIFNSLDLSLTGSAAEAAVKPLSPIPVYQPPAGERNRRRRDMRPFLKPEDQGPINSCQGNALSTCMEALIWYQFGIVTHLSRMYAYLRAQERVRRVSKGGSSITVGAVVAHEEGIPAERYHPYPQRWNGNIPEQAREHAGDFKIRQIVRLQSAADCVDFLGDDEPGVIHFGMIWDGQMSSGQKRYDSLNLGRGGAHAVMLSNLGTMVDQTGLPDVNLHNSHHRRWGDDGNSLLSGAALTNAWQASYCEAIGYRGIEVASRQALEEAML